MHHYELSSQQTKQAINRQNYYSQLKFMSVKSILKNKKIIIKKTIPNDMFKNKTEDTFFQGTFPMSQEKIFPSRVEKLQRNKQSSRKNQGFSTNPFSNLPSGGNTNVVTIKFGDSVLDAKRQKEAKNKRRVLYQQIPEEGRKNNSFYKQNKSGRSAEKSQTGKFKQMLIVEAFQKNGDGIYDILGRKKSMTNGQIIMRKKSNKSSVGSVIGTNRTISDFQSVSIGTKMGVEKKRKRRKIATALYRPSQEGKQKIRQIQSIQTPTTEQIKQFKDILPLRKPNNKKDHFVFGLSDKPSEGENKIELYRDFLWKMNYSNALYVVTPESLDVSYRVFVGLGNNSCMIKSILRRRFWWNIVEDKSQIDTCQFVWTQLKINTLFKLQKDGKIKQFFTDSRKMNEKIKENDQMQIAHQKIFNKVDLHNWERYYIKNLKWQEKISQQTYIKRLNLLFKKDFQKVLDSSKLRMHNHLESNYYIGNKKALYYNCKKLCEFKGEDIFKYLPVTFHIVKGMDDTAYQDFLKCYSFMQEIKKTDRNFRNIWIAKPGENTNQGNGISVCFGLDDVKHRLRGRERNSDGKLRTFILQKYIQRPLLYKNRKFDVRHFVLVTCINGSFKAYWYQQGYIRTSSSVFNLKDMKDIQVHLTNDAVQKRSEGYGKFQKGNKLSYEQFQKYLDKNRSKKKHSFFKKILPKMRDIAKMAIQSTYSILDLNRKEFNFELLGLDFMIDEHFHPWLIEVNTNPCLELSCPLLQRIIPNLIEQTLRLTIDPIFPPPENWVLNRKHFFGQNTLLDNKFQLLFDEKIDGAGLNTFHQEKKDNLETYLGKIEEEGDIFQDDGNDKWQTRSQL